MNFNSIVNLFRPSWVAILLVRLAFKRVYLHDFDALFGPIVPRRPAIHAYAGPYSETTENVATSIQRMRLHSAVDRPAFGPFQEFLFVMTPSARVFVHELGLFGREEKSTRHYPPDLFGSPRRLHDSLTGVAV